VLPLHLSGSRADVCHRLPGVRRRFLTPVADVGSGRLLDVFEGRDAKHLRLVVAMDDDVERLYATNLGRRVRMLVTG